MKLNVICVYLLFIVNSLNGSSIENQFEYYNRIAPYYQNLLKQQPDNIDLICDTGFVLKKIGNFATAKNLYEQALSLDPNHPRTHRALSHILLAQADFEHGWHHYEWRWIPVPPFAYEVKAHIERHHSLHNVRLLLKTEYGFGDMLQFIRYAQIFKELGAYIILECHPKLVNILSLCPYLDEIIPAGQQLPAYDLQTFIMSGPLICSTKLDSIPGKIPYLYADQNLIAHWKDYFANDTSFKIGICWQADLHKDSNNTVQDDAQEKSLAIDYFAELAQLPGIKLFSLQKHIDAITEEKIRALGIHVFEHFDEERGCFMDTAAIMEHMDLIISIDTSLAHLAGGLGKPVWVLLPHFADWRWLNNRADSPWYPTMKLFRQTAPGDWKSVITEISHAMQGMIS